MRSSEFLDPADFQKHLLDELKQIRTQLKEHLLGHPVSLSTETAHAYNKTLFHLQSARDEIKKVMRTLHTNTSSEV